jgi:hypothetical protein
MTKGSQVVAGKVSAMLAGDQAGTSTYLAFRGQSRCMVSQSQRPVYSLLESHGLGAGPASPLPPYCDWVT